MYFFVAQLLLFLSSLFYFSFVLFVLRRFTGLQTEDNPTTFSSDNVEHHELEEDVKGFRFQNFTSGRLI